jgi:hypothetical protein
MKNNPRFIITDEAIAFIVFLLCCVISFFRHPVVIDTAFTVAN